MGALETYSRYVNDDWLQTLAPLGEVPVFIRAGGDRLHDSQGDEWFDFIGHYGAMLFGHHHPALQQALIAALADELPIGAPLGITAHGATLAQQLVEKLALGDGWNNWTLTTGAEAVEGALKIALTVTGRQKILARTGAFHGLSSLTLALNNMPFWRQGYEALVPDDGVTFFDDPQDLPALLASGEYAAVIIEPLQAIAGGRRLDAAQAGAIRLACTNTGTLFIVDEIFTGLGRCGDYSAMQALGWAIRPDIILLAKTLTGGLMPSAQLLVKQPFFHAFTGRPGCAKLIASTFSGNNLGHQVALASLQLLTDTLETPGLMARHDHFSSRLQALAVRYPRLLQGVSSLGALHFLHFTTPDAAQLSWHYLHANKILTTLCAHQPATLKLIPSLFQSDEANDALYNVLDYVCEEENEHVR
ncbi:aminotransferase class III-fold pyridoxal phosphate-dependent enzyme [Chimaeribacter arupi]|uniref:aminotransferase class III-fold pyridoxal phosphate-dependent enzyme n=1 Tax=Chimaeribacter arupi TaxID=2060066 RepID=UPI002711FDEB|nr:aminotransferase class III-fold pyridoxal phosphate-dependent enzyme [Chimaeribacter arupi]WKZ93556.1 aminotransferase class III-fold pyridoxal phosphate-dependent enzyme [Chimaeribacter arupi]